MPSQWLRELSLESGFDMIAVVDSREIEAVTDYEKVIVLGLIVPDTSAEFTLKLEVDGKIKWSKWVYEILENKARKLAWRLGMEGIEVEPLEFVESWKRIDLKRAAITGGLGVMGENNLVLNRDWGPRLRFTAIFANIDEEADSPLNSELCNMCTICIRECPTGALDRAIFDRGKCLAEFDPDDRMMGEKERSIRMVTPYTKEQCSLCITSCPFGMFHDIRVLPGL